MSTADKDHDHNISALNLADTQLVQATLDASKLSSPNNGPAIRSGDVSACPSRRGSTPRNTNSDQVSPALAPLFPLPDSTCRSDPPKTKPTDNPDTVEDTTSRNAWGDSRFAEESKMMKTHADSLFAAGVISASQAAKLSVPWHEKGAVNGSIWEEQYLDPSKKVTEYDIMPYERAQRIQHRKDVALKKWLEDWEAGRIDDDGNPLVRRRDSEWSTGNTAANAEGSDGVAESMEGGESCRAECKSGGAGDATQGRYSVVEKSRPDTPGKNKKPIGMKDKAEPQDLEAIAESPSSTQSSMTDPPSSFPSSSSESADNVSVPTPPLATARPPTKVAAHPRENAPNHAPAGPSILIWALSQPSKSTTPYDNVEYSELLRLCRIRGLKRSGNAETLRKRLVADDAAVRDGTARKDLSKYTTPADGSVRPRGVTGKRRRIEEDKEEDKKPERKKLRVAK
ncbi:uncharacterized protein EI97DRAFT_461902 [Westerdykella ornata]|uniref:Uncharacterized protein n=1 Tax=Westerdykella ornata TaxID=318751 RepID=A0A6A6J7X8_WESOR|nr:uncharacterized protein EI97DRAFT_461902 [Westerdykella ornata]KAF2272512.1 hypothetical protein EI97DRAFT_461902 [Westerdykella ornata]